MSEEKPFFTDIELDVVKLGGTSMLDIEASARAIEHPECKIAAVSAYGGDEDRYGEQTRVTQDLIKLHGYGVESDRARSLRDEIIARHIVKARSAGISNTGEMGDVFRGWFAEAGSDEAEIKYLGERMSTEVLARYMGAVALDAREVIYFADDYSQVIDLPKTSHALRTAMADGADQYILAGFAGSYNGKTRTFPQSGTDRTGSVAARALQATRYTNSKEVLGVYSQDPNRIPTAEIQRELTYREIRAFASSVLMRDVILDLAGTGIDTYVRHTFERDDPGTRITDYRVSPSGELLVAIDGDVSRYASLHKYGMNEQVNAGTRILDYVSGRGVSWEDAPTATDQVDFTWPLSSGSEARDEQFTDGLHREFSDHTVHGGKIGRLHLVGQKQLETEAGHEVQMRVARALKDAGIRRRGENGGIDTPSSVVYIDAEHVDEAVRAVHDSFFTAA